MSNDEGNTASRPSIAALNPPDEFDYCQSLTCSPSIHAASHRLSWLDCGAEFERLLCPLAAAPFLEKQAAKPGPVGHPPHELGYALTCAERERDAAVAELDTLKMMRGQRDAAEADLGAERTTATELRASYLAAEKERRAAVARAEKAEAALADCYRQTGADPDGNEDWRLAKDAAKAVSEFRVEFDARQSENIALEAKLAAAEKELADGWYIWRETEQAAANLLKERYTAEKERDDYRARFTTANQQLIQNERNAIIGASETTLTVYRERAEAAAKERDRLRDALERLSKLPEGPRAGCVPQYEVRAICQAALGAPGGEGT